MFATIFKPAFWTRAVTCAGFCAMEGLPMSNTVCSTPFVRFAIPFQRNMFGWMRWRKRDDVDLSRGRPTHPSFGEDTMTDEIGTVRSFAFLFIDRQHFGLHEPFALIVLEVFMKIEQNQITILGAETLGLTNFLHIWCEARVVEPSLSH